MPLHCDGRWRSQQRLTRRLECASAVENGHVKHSVKRAATQMAVAAQPQAVMSRQLPRMLKDWGRAEATSATAAAANCAVTMTAVGPQWC